MFPISPLRSITTCDRVEIAPSTRNADFEVDAKLIGSNRVHYRNLREISGWTHVFASHRATAKCLRRALDYRSTHHRGVGVVFFFAARRADPKNRTFRKSISVGDRRDIVEALCQIGQRTYGFRRRQLIKRCLFEGKIPSSSLIRDRLGENHVRWFATGTNILLKKRLVFSS